MYNLKTVESRTLKIFFFDRSLFLRKLTSLIYHTYRINISFRFCLILADVFTLTLLPFQQYDLFVDLCSGFFKLDSQSTVFDFVPNIKTEMSFISAPEPMKSLHRAFFFSA
jgi:hypothetical protein